MIFQQLIPLCSRYRLEDNIEMNLKEIGWEDVDWIFLDTDQCWALVNTIMNLHFP
jgi:hypothetical protein